MLHKDAGVLDFNYGGFNCQQVIQMRCFYVISLEMTNDEDDAELLQHRFILKTEETQEFRASALGEFEVIGMINHPARVGVFVVDTYVDGIGLTGFKN